jgi:hypothetical protein
MSESTIEGTDSIKKPGKKKKTVDILKGNTTNYSWVLPKEGPEVVLST